MTDLRKMSNEAINERTQLADASQKELCAEISLAEDGEFGLGLFDVLQEMYNAGYARGAAPAEEMKPRCPKCGSDALELWVEEVGETVKVTCLKKPHGFLIQSVNDFAQFFALSPARSGEPPTVEVFVKTFLSRVAGLSEEQSSNIEETLSHMLRPYFPPASTARTDRAK